MKKIATICLLLFGMLIAQAQNLKPFKADNGKYGYKDDQGGIAIQPQYDAANGFSEGMAAVNAGGKADLFGVKGGKWGYINAAGKVVVPLLYHKASRFSEGLAAVSYGLSDEEGGGHLSKFIDKNGETVLDGYEDAQPFFEGLAAVKVFDLWGFIDKAGKQVTQMEYTSVSSFLNGKALVVLMGREFYIDKTGKEIK